MSTPVVITTNEPRTVKDLFDNKIELPMDFDMKLYTACGEAGIERKKIPSDLISSVEDGRLGREILAMREECAIMIVLWHGKFRFLPNGNLYLGKRTSKRWTEKGIRNLRRTLELVEGCLVEHARNNAELVQIVAELQEYLDEDSHLSTKGRSPIRTDWIKPTYYERVRYFYDGLPGVAVVGAQKLATKFPHPMDLYGASIKEIMDVPRMGKSVATGIYNFLRGLNE